MRSASFNTLALKILPLTTDGFPYAYYNRKDARAKVRTFLLGTYLFVSYSYNDTCSNRLQKKLPFEAL
jgi:hypothetical protein